MSLALVVGFLVAGGYGLLAFVLAGAWPWASMAVVGILVALMVPGVRQWSEGLAQKEQQLRHAPSDSVRVVSAAAARPAVRKAAVRKADPAADVSPKAERPAAAAETVPAEVRTAAPVPVAPRPAQAEPTDDSEGLWQAALALERTLNGGPPEENGPYLDLVHQAAEGGHVAALARLGTFAYGRAAFVEAYFWSKLARRRLKDAPFRTMQGLSEIDQLLQDIRYAWARSGYPLEYENVYEAFPEERGELGRALLRIDSGLEVPQSREFVAMLAARGNPDAALLKG